MTLNEIDIHVSRQIYDGELILSLKNRVVELVRENAELKREVERLQERLRELEQGRAE